MTTCALVNPTCHAPAAFRIYMGCVHEHIYLSVTCAEHAKTARRRGVTCHLCHVGPEPHECPARIVKPPVR